MFDFPQGQSYLETRKVDIRISLSTKNIRLIDLSFFDKIENRKSR